MLVLLRRGSNASGQQIISLSIFLSLSVLKWMSEWMSFNHASCFVLFFSQTFSQSKPLLVQCWKEMCVCVCISPTWLCRKTVWMRTQHAADRQHLHCKGLSWLPPLTRPSVVFMRREGVTEESWLQQASRCSVHLRRQGWTEKQALVVQPEWQIWFPGWGPTICWTDCRAVAWLDAVWTDFVTDWSKSKFCVLRHERKACWLAYRRTNSNQSFSSIASVCSLIWSEAVVITQAATSGHLSLTCVRLSSG